MHAMLVASTPLLMRHGLRCMQAGALRVPQVRLILSDQLVEQPARGRHELRKVAPLRLQRIAVVHVPSLPLLPGRSLRALNI